jgi:hypothetical protein
LEAGFFGAVLALGGVTLYQYLPLPVPDYFEQPPSPSAAPHPDALAEQSGLDYEPPSDDEDHRYSLFRRRRAMPPVGKWSRLYVTTSRDHRRVVIAIARGHSFRKPGATWTLVDNQRRASTMSMNDRRRVHAQALPGILRMDPAGPTHEEMGDDEEGSRDPVLRSVPTLIAIAPRHRSGLAGPSTSACSWSSIGAGVFVLTVWWWCARYLELYSYAPSAFTTMMDAAELVQAARESLQHMKGGGGVVALIPPVGWPGLFGLLIWAMLCLRAPWASLVAPQGPELREPGIQAGPSPPTSDDEQTDDTASDHLIETLQSRVLMLEKTHARSAVPANIVERMSLPFLLQIFSVHPNLTSMANRWVQEKELQRNHVGHEMVLMCLVMDKSLWASLDFVNCEACEILCRRILALETAFENVKSMKDWRQPSGTASRRWKSKVRWDLAGRIDVRAVSGDTESEPGIEGYLQHRLKERALLNKYVDQVTVGGAADDQ